jgi:hypothetical protein
MDVIDSRGFKRVCSNSSFNKAIGADLTPCVAHQASGVPRCVLLHRKVRACFANHVSDGGFGNLGNAEKSCPVCSCELLAYSCDQNT